MVSAGIRRLPWITISVITSCCAQSTPQNNTSKAKRQFAIRLQAKVNEGDFAPDGRLRRHCFHDADLSLSTRRIAYYLSFREYGKRQLYGRAAETVQNRPLKAVVRAPLEEGRNKTQQSCLLAKFFLVWLWELGTLDLTNWSSGNRWFQFSHRSSALC